MNEERVFEHRLYHLVYHWAAYVATLVLLLSLGALVAVTPEKSIRYPWYLRAANIAGGAASWFFLYRMKFFGDQVIRLLGGRDMAANWRLAHPRNLYLGALVTLVIVVINCLLV